jgi:hypothetical protein
MKEKVEEKEVRGIRRGETLFAVSFSGAERGKMRLAEAKNRVRS